MTPTDNEGAREWGVVLVDINAERESWAYGPLTIEDARQCVRSIRNPRSYTQPMAVLLSLYPDLQLRTWAGA